MMKSRILIAIMLLPLALMSLKAGEKESFAADYKKAIQQYLKHHKMEVKIKYSLYSDFTGHTLVSGSDGIIKKDGDRLYSDCLDKIMLNTGRYVLNIDKKQKLLFVNELVKAKKPTNKDKDMFAEAGITDMMPLMDSFVNRLKDVKLINSEGHVKTYKIIMTDSRFKAMDISIDVAAGLMKKVVVYPMAAPAGAKDKFKSIPRVEISYEETSFSPGFQKDDFAISRFVKKVNNKYIPADDYKNYRVIYKKLPVK